MIQIPIFIDDKANFSMEIELDQVLTTIWITYNIRAVDFFAVFSWSGDSVGPVRLVPNFPILLHHKGYTPLGGDFIVLSLANSTATEVTYGNFGTDFGLFYLDASELALWRQQNGL